MVSLKGGRTVAGMLVALQGAMLVACGGSSAREHRLWRTDSLNTVAYEERYKDLNASQKAAQAAYVSAQGNSRQVAEALNNRAFYAFMRMDFEGAARLYSRAEQVSHSEMEALVADIGMMKICQRTSRNKEFYDYRNRALRRMKRIREDEAWVGERERKRLNYALSEFYIVSGIYYYYLQQHAASMEAIRSVTPDMLAADSAQWLYYEYMVGSGDMYEAPTPEDIVEGEFLHLTNCLLAARSKGYVYFEANALQGMAEMLTDPDKRELLQHRKLGLLRLVNVDGLPVDSLPLVFARRALKLFRQYGDWYQISGTYRSMASYYNSIGRHEEALHYLSEALQYVNYHHERYYYCKDTTDRLRLFDASSATPVEQKWIVNEGIRTVPEWILRLREQLSLTYSAMGRKPESDYNRNIYLDLLDYTRQDKELESRYAALDEERQQLNAVLALVLVGFLLLVGLATALSRRWRQRNRQYLLTLRQVLELCRRVTVAVPSQAREKEEVAAAVEAILRPELKRLLQAADVCVACGEEEERTSSWLSWRLVAPGKEVPVGTLWMDVPRPLRKEEQAWLSLMLPYLAWTLENGLNFVALEEERRRLEKELYVHQQHLAENKRQNEVKKACLSVVTGILPYMDRVVNEVAKLRTRTLQDAPEVRQGRLAYIRELMAKMNEYNDILAVWIKMRRGAVSLNIEHFEVDDLFRMLAKGKRSFEMKRQTFEVMPTSAVVKADKALTLFMMNTLAENARKYTPEGGTVRVEAVEEADYVEIAVSDNGPGLSPEDIQHLLGEKVYDSQTIGLATAADVEALRRQKGQGFGLMNCKGIIEKYRKTNALFSVCAFQIDSVPGQGSRFSFRLPKGTRRGLLAVCLLAGSVLWPSCRAGQPEAVPEAVAADTLLSCADQCANQVYYHNVNGRYQAALGAADSALMYLNRHYQACSGQDAPLLVMQGKEVPAEQQWLEAAFDTDYYILLDVRNEVAVAALALNDFSLYSYNNAAYAALYRQISRDRSLEAYCEQMQRSSNGKLVGLGLFGLLLVLCLLGYYLLYVRHRLRYRYNMEQLFQVYRAIMEGGTAAGMEDDRMLHRLVTGLYTELNELMPLSDLALAVLDEDAHKFHAAFYRKEDDAEELHMQLQSHLGRPSAEWGTAGGWSYLPLWVDTADERHCIGVLALRLARPVQREEDGLLVELAAGYLAVVLYHTVVCVRRKFGDIEEANDEARRLLFEVNQLHVQNQVLDNCLSTIKHETIYYPNRIRQVVERLENESLAGTVTDEQASLQTLDELLAYYRDIFTLLTRCAARQLDEVTFRRMEVEVDGLLQGALKYQRKICGRRAAPLDLSVEVPQPVSVIGDRVLLDFLFRNLADEACRCPQSGHLRLTARRQGDFVRFDWTDSRRSPSQAELDGLFYPDLRRLSVDESDRLCGTEYLVCKQIIRDHDEYAGRRGCRINATALEGGGFSVWFTLPLKL